MRAGGPARTIVLLAALGPAACQAAPDLPLDAACDIRAPDCQRRVFLAVQQLRNQSWEPWTEPPRVRMISADDLRREVEGENARFGRDPWSPALQDLGLLPKGVDSFLASQGWRRDFTEAYYYQWVVTIVDRGLELDTSWAVATLAHEYVHALQDRESGLFLYGRPARHTERDWIERTTVEGEAALFESLLTRHLAGLPLVDPEIESFFDQRLQGTRRGLAGEASRDTWVRNAFPYALGAVAFARAWNRHGSIGAARLWGTPPARSLFFMMDPATAAALGTVEVGPPPCGPPPSPPGHLLLEGDSLGALYFYAFLMDSLPEEEAWRQALGWRGDRIWLYQRADGARVASIWRLRVPGFDPARLGGGKAGRTWEHTTEGNDLVVVSADDAAVRRALIERAACMPPR